MAQSPAGADNFILQESIGEYSDEAYTNARKLSGTAIVAGNPLIDKNTETFIGQMRWFKPLKPVINVASLTDRTDGQKTSYSSQMQQYIKTVRTHGAEKVNMQEVVTQKDGLEKIGRDFAETRAQDEHNAILSVLKGIAISEALKGAGGDGATAGLGGQTFFNDPEDPRYGFYVDLGANKMVADRAAGGAVGAERAEAIINAFGMAYKDFEPPFAYLAVNPAVFASFRSANLLGDKVTEGNIEFDTIFEGKFRLIQTRATQSLMGTEMAKINAGAGVDIVGQYTSFVILPGALAMEPLTVPVPVEIDRDASSFHGGGSTEIWYRWGYVLAPAGYSWAGSDEAFPTDQDYMSVVNSATGLQTPLSNVAGGDLGTTRGVWQRKTSSALSLGILPIFHS